MELNTNLRRDRILEGGNVTKICIIEYDTCRNDNSKIVSCFCRIMVIGWWRRLVYDSEQIVSAEMIQIRMQSSEIGLRFNFTL